MKRAETEREWQEKFQLHQEVAAELAGKTEAEQNAILGQLPRVSGLQASLVASQAGRGRSLSLSKALKKQLAASRKVCVVMTPGKFLGTGFLISLQHVITNQHVFAAADNPNHLQAVFDFDGSQPLDRLPARQVKFSGSVLTSDVRDLDYTVLPLDKPVEADRGFFSACLDKPNDKDAVIVLGHPGERVGGNQKVVPKDLQISAGSIRDINSQNHKLAYTADTAPGSSGSPVLNGSFDLIGLHNHGESLVNNHGVMIDAIFEDLQRKSSGLMTSLPPATEVGELALSPGGLQGADWESVRPSTTKSATGVEIAVRGAAPQYEFNGRRKLEFEKRLMEDWRSLATFLEIPAHKQATWKQGYESDAIWTYLNSRQDLNSLPEALIYIEREDLARIFI